MSYQANPREIENVLRLPADRRYAYFLGKVVDWQEVWSCRGAGGWVLCSHEGRECVPVWPAEAYAELSCTGVWAGATPHAISLDAWVERWLPGMIRDARGVAIFPTSGGKVSVIEPTELLADIRRLLDSSGLSEDE